MRNLQFLVLLLFFSNSYSQNKKYHFCSEKTIEIKKAYYTEKVYIVSKQKIFIPKFDTIKSFTAEYIQEIKENEKQIKDSLTAVEDFKLQYLEQTKLNKIATKLMFFLNSNDKFKIKKQFLMDAQQISDSLSNKKILKSNYSKVIFGRGVIDCQSQLIYSDKDFNIDFKNIFNEINYNDENLKYYYQQMIRNIENLPKPVFNWTRKIKGQIKSRDGIAKEVKKFNISYKLIDSIATDGYLRKDEIDASKLNGEFIVIDECQFVFENKNFVINQIILKSAEKSIKGNNNFSYSDALIWNAITNEYYTTSFSTLNQLAIIEDEKYLFFENLKKNGFITKHIYGDVCILMNNKFIKINENLIEKFQKTGIIYLTNLSKSLDNYHQLATVGKPLIERINGHIGAYRYGTLTAARLAQWKTDNKQAQIIANKFKLIKEIEEVYFADYLAINYDDYFVHKNQQIKIALDTAILVSNQVLGM